MADRPIHEAIAAIYKVLAVHPDALWPGEEVTLQQAIEILVKLKHAKEKPHG